MKSKTSSNSRSSAGKEKQTSTGEVLESSKLMKLFEDELKDIYWAEKALTKALPKMSKNSTSQELADAIDKHLAETEEHVKRVEEVFETIGKKAVAKKCEAMDGLIREGEQIMQDTDEGMMRDAGIISAGQKVEHYEIATYGTLRTFANTLGLDEAATLLEGILEEEKAADEKLTEIAESEINIGAANEEEEEK